MVDQSLAVYTSDDKDDKCTAVLNFSKNTVKVTTKDFETSCGMHALGSMDDIYKNKVSLT